MSDEATRLDGVVLYDKPAGISSAGAVATVRRARGGRGVKVGHAGTLDPFATGLLLILVGRATRVQRFLMALPKRYETVARFGATSTTGDPEGEITETGVIPGADLELPTGRLRQRPPAYSAVKVAGRRAYALARRGQTSLVLPEREIEVYRFDQLWRDGERGGFAIECSSGTYVRSLIADLGDAYCEQLRRTAIGPFEVADADPDAVIPLPQALAFLPELYVDGEQATRAGHGLSVQAPAGFGRQAAVRITGEEGLIALGEPAGDGTELKPVVGFSPPIRDLSARRS